MDVYIITGSPCGGKSTLAERFAEERGCDLYRLDDDLYPFMERLAAGGNEACKANLSQSPEEMWMQEPDLMCREEIEIYRAMLPLIMEKLGAFPGTVVAEGAGFLPEEMKALGIPADRYICITPTREFQVKHYSKRDWVPAMLAGCTDPEQAFANWMERDALFGEYMVAQAVGQGYQTMCVDGGKTIDENYVALCEALGG